MSKVKEGRHLWLILLCSHWLMSCCQECKNWLQTWWPSRVVTWQMPRSRYGRHCSSPTYWIECQTLLLHEVRFTLNIMLSLWLVQSIENTRILIASQTNKARWCILHSQLFAPVFTSEFLQHHLDGFVGSSSQVDQFCAHNEQAKTALQEACSKRNDTALQSVSKVGRGDKLSKLFHCQILLKPINE